MQTTLKLDRFWLAKLRAPARKKSDHYVLVVHVSGAKRRRWGARVSKVLDFAGTPPGIPQTIRPVFIRPEDKDCTLVVYSNGIELFSQINDSVAIWRFRRG